MFGFGKRGDRVAAQPTTKSMSGKAGPHYGGTALLDEPERNRLRNALRANVTDGKVLMMDSRDTTFIGTNDEVADDEVINAVKSLPCHY